MSDQDRDQAADPKGPDLAEALGKLQELYGQAQQLVAAYRTNKIAYYRPNPVGNQGNFHAANGVDTRLVLGGNRSGKTTCGTVEAIAHALGHRPWLAPEDPNYVVRLADGSPIPVPNVGRIVFQSYEVNAVQTIYPKFQEWLPERHVRHVQRNQHGAPTRIDLTNGSVIHLMSYKQDSRAFEGPAGHWFWFDEPMPQSIFNGLKRGLVDHAGVCWGTMTPLTEPWLAEVLFANANEPGSGIMAWEFSIWDNCVENGGTLTSAAIMSLLSKLPAHERATREHGKFLHLSGRVFPTWRPEPPYWIEPIHIPADWPRVCVIDPHPNKPIAVTWLAVRPDDSVVIYRDLADPELYTVRDVADEIKALEGWAEDQRTGKTRRTLATERIAYRIIDSSANENERSSGRSTKEEFANYGIVCVDAHKRNRNAGINAIREAITPGPYQWSRVMLQVVNTCRHVKKNFLMYAWPREITSRRDDPKAAKQDPVKVHDDHIDCIRYFYQARLSYQLLVNAMRQLGYRDDDDDEDEPPPHAPPRPGLHAGYQRLRRKH